MQTFDLLWKYQHIFRIYLSIVKIKSVINIFFTICSADFVSHLKSAPEQAFVRTDHWVDLRTKHLIFYIAAAYLASTMALGTLSVCLTVGVLNLHHRGSNSPVPGWARTFFLKRCAKIFGLPPIEHKKHYFSSNSVRIKKARPNNIKLQEFDQIRDAPDFYEVRPHISHHSSISDKQRKLQDSLTDNLACAESYLMTETILNESMQYHNVTVAPPGSGRCSRRGSVRSTRSRAGSPCNQRPSAEEVLDQEHREEIVREWHLLARVLDRILFCVVFFTMLCCAVFILLSPWYLGVRSSPRQRGNVWWCWD